MTTKLAYSVAEAAAATGLSKSHIYELIHAGTIAAKTSRPKKNADASHGGKLLILAAELSRYIESLVDA
jgi:hypothetical protein